MCATDSTNKDLGLTDKNSSCSCSTESHAAAASDSATPTDSSKITEQVLVEGMTCGHCVASVTEEVSAIAGVESVSVDLQAGGASRVMIVSDRPVPTEQIRDAVTEAGYTLVAN